MMQETVKEERIEEVMLDRNSYVRELGDRICRLRKEQGISQRQLGEMIGLSQQMIADFEVGRRNIPVWRAFDLAEALGVSVETLLGTSDAKPLKRGPAPKLQKLLAEVVRLPKSRQRFVTEMLEHALHSG